MALATLMLAGCANVHQVGWQRIDGTTCMTTKVNPVWYSSETETDCLVAGKAVTVPTNHDDFSIVGYPAAAVIGLAAGAGL